MKFPITASIMYVLIFAAAAFALDAKAEEYRRDRRQDRRQERRHEFERRHEWRQSDHRSDFRENHARLAEDRNIKWQERRDAKANGAGKTASGTAPAPVTTPVTSVTSTTPVASTTPSTQGQQNN